MTFLKRLRIQKFYLLICQNIKDITLIEMTINSLQIWKDP